MRLRRFERFKSWIARGCASLIEVLRPKLDKDATIRALLEDLGVAQEKERQRRSDVLEDIAEMREAMQMAGSGPWVIGPETARQGNALMKAATESLRTGVRLQEAGEPIGASGDVALWADMLEWRREGNFDWMEFSHYGIRLIILLCRRYFIKNPLIRRGIKISAAYVFGRGFEVSSDNQTADDTLKAFFEANKTVLGQVAMAEHHERKFYDGNLFWALFADTQNTGSVKIRTIDATEIMEIICNPQDSDEPWFYKRVWTQKNFDAATGAVSSQDITAYYPALGFDPANNAAAKNVGIIPDQPQIDGKDIKWDCPVLHRKCGTVSKWHFGIPLAYPALAWAKSARKLLEDCATVRRSLAQIAWEISTKGGQQAIQGIKQQLGTTVGPTSPLWDNNPDAVAGSTFVAGPGTKMQVMKTAGAGGNPEDVRRYIHWVAMVFGLPETFFADASVGTVATAQSLDRPTELYMLLQQEEWREDLTTIALYVLNVSKSAPSGKLRESLEGIGETNIVITEAKRVTLPTGRLVYEKSAPQPNKIQVKVNFPAIREGDLPANVIAITDAMTLQNKGGQVVGIDEKVGVGLLYSEFGVENYQDILDEQYPKDYDPDRTVEPLPAPIGKVLPDPGGEPQAPGGRDAKPQDKAVAGAEGRRVSRNALMVSERLTGKRVIAAAVKVSESRKLTRSKKLREAVAAGATQKSWVGGTCPACQENADAGWIDEDETFPSGDDEPPAHPNCSCDIETRTA